MTDAPKPSQNEQDETQEELPIPAGFMEMPAIFSDTYSIRYWSDRLRIAFAEGTNKQGEPYFRSAVVMPMEIAEALLQSLIEIRDEMNEAKKKKG